MHRTRVVTGNPDVMESTNGDHGWSCAPLGITYKCNSSLHTNLSVVLIVGECMMGTPNTLFAKCGLKKVENYDVPLWYQTKQKIRIFFFLFLQCVLTGVYTWHNKWNIIQIVVRRGWWPRVTGDPRGRFWWRARYTYNYKRYHLG